MKKQGASEKRFRKPLAHRSNSTKVWPNRGEKKTHFKCIIGCVHSFSLSRFIINNLFFPSSAFSKVTHDTSHPPFPSSNRVSRSHSFTPQSHTENILSGILILRGSHTTFTDSICQTGYVSIVMVFVVVSLLGCVFSTILDSVV